MPQGRQKLEEDRERWMRGEKVFHILLVLLGLVLIDASLGSHDFLPSSCYTLAANYSIVSLINLEPFEIVQGNTD